MTTLNEVLVLLDGTEGIRRCRICFGEAYSLLTQYYSTPIHYHTRATIHCVNGHARVLIGAPEPLDDEMRQLLA